MAVGRRTFFMSAAGLAAAAVGGLRWSATQWRTALGQVTARLPHATGVIGRGTEYLTRVPEEADVATLTTRLIGDRTFNLVGIDSDQLVRRLDRQIADDFSTERVLFLGGWMLSRTELRLCALATLGTQVEPHAPFGLFTLATTPDGTQGRHTTSNLSLPISETRERLQVPIRNPAPFERTVAVSLDDRPVNEVPLAPESGWHTIEYDLARRARPVGRPSATPLPRQKESAPPGQIKQGRHGTRRKRHCLRGVHASRQRQRPTRPSNLRPPVTWRS